MKTFTLIIIVLNVLFVGVDVLRHNYPLALFNTAAAGVLGVAYRYKYGR